MMDLNSNFRYGIMLSGGLDSSILLYLILLNAKNKNAKLNIQPFSIPKHDGSHNFVPRILDYFRNQFSLEIPNTILVGDPNVHHTVQSKVAITELFIRYPQIDFVILGTNQNPKSDFDYSPHGEDGFPKRVSGPNHPKVIIPFIELEKTDILKLIIDHNQEKLFEITHSCTEQKTGRCGRCFQCEERAWAFSKLNLVDPGIN